MTMGFMDLFLCCAFHKPDPQVETDTARKSTSKPSRTIAIPVDDTDELRVVPGPPRDGTSSPIPDPAPRLQSLPSPLPSPHAASDLLLTTNLIQELSSASSNCSNRKSVIPEAMALLCTKLNMTWACLTAFSSTCQHFQHCGAAHVAPLDPSPSTRMGNPRGERLSGSTSDRLSFESQSAAPRQPFTHGATGYELSSSQPSRDESREQHDRDSGVKTASPFPVSLHCIDSAYLFPQSN